MQGYVYILSNPSMPGLVKIGKTERVPSERAVELHSTGVPVPFKIEWFGLFENMNGIERSLHQTFKHQRVHAGREFFTLDIKVAIARAIQLRPALSGGYEDLQKHTKEMLEKVQVSLAHKTSERIKAEERQNADRDRETGIVYWANCYICEHVKTTCDDLIVRKRAEAIAKWGREVSVYFSFRIGADRIDDLRTFGSNELARRAEALLKHGLTISIRVEKTDVIRHFFKKAERNTYLIARAEPRITPPTYAEAREYGTKQEAESHKGLVQARINLELAALNIADRSRPQAKTRKSKQRKRLTDYRPKTSPY